MADFTLNESSANESQKNADANDPGMQLFQLEKVLFEIRQQPGWRLSADIEADYYDSNQLDSQTLYDMEERGQAPIIENLIKPAIDVVLGMEVKSRTDWKVRPGGDGKVNSDLADALSLKLHNAELESRADRSISDAYAHQMKVGMGWVEVARESDPMKGPYRVQNIHRREIWWDWRAKKSDLSDARYLLRRQWLDEDIAIAAFPKAKKIIQVLSGTMAMNDIITTEDTDLAMSLETARTTSIDQSEWLNAERHLVCIYEMWYRKMVRGYVIRLPNGRVVELNLNNDKHCEAILCGIAKPQPASFMKPFQSWWIGPHKMSDGPSPYRHDWFPYVPFIGYREDRTGVPYGLIRSMRSGQDDVNSRKQKMRWLLSSSRVLADDDAVKDHNLAAAEVARPDAYVILNSNRKPSSKFSVEDGGNLATQQFEVYKDAKDSIAQAAGIYQSMMGNNSNASSGTAINSLVEQGTIGLAEINDNARFARRQVGEILLSLVMEDLEGRPIAVTIDDGLAERVVNLNTPTLDPQTGAMKLENDVSAANVRVVIDDVQSSPTYRAQQQAQLMELTKSLPPQAQGLIIDFVIEATDLPNRREMAERLRTGLGIKSANETPDPEKQQMGQQINQLHGIIQQGQQEVAQGKAAYDKQIADLQAQLQSAQAGMQAHETDAKVSEIQAKADKQEADAMLSRAKAYQIAKAVEISERAEIAAGTVRDQAEQIVENMVFGHA
ncbi:MAG: portal protein [Sulfuriferula sp.]